MSLGSERSAPDRATRVLIVDDIAANRAVMTRRLEMLSFAAESVESGREALDYLSHAKPDIVLLDYMMPQMNGIEVLHRLRSNPRTANLPVIMVTARAESEATVEALNAGADDYVTKPVDYEVLKARIETLVDRTCDASNLRLENATLDERVTMRNMVVADLEQDLRSEIEKRVDLEKQLADQAEHKAPELGQGAHLTDVRVALQDIDALYETLVAEVIAGRTPKLLEMLKVRKAIAALIEDLACKTK